jgi:chemotaxis regulatin CheY-phosphate phosphatase CheZ
LASTPESAHYRPIADALEDAVAKKIDRIAQMLNCPVKGEELRRAVTESRKEFLLNQPEETVAEDDDLEEELFEEDEDDEYDEFDWTTE